MANGIKINEESFDELKDTDAKLHAIFREVAQLNLNLRKQIKICEPRFRTIENRKWIDKGIASVLGIVGGILGFLGIKIT